MNDTTKPWGGRFDQATDARVEDFTASVDFDCRLWRQDIQGSIAHARMLADVGVLDAREREQIVAGLEAIGDDIAAGRFEWSGALEDVHMNIETALIERIGDVGKKLHTGRSRNDQIATDMRLYLREAIDAIGLELRRLMEVLVDVAEREADSIMPGFTHLQAAQPVSFGHHMLAWFEMLWRDHARLADCRRRVNVSPLGAAALAGTTFPIDRQATAEALGFAGVAENSLDAVSDRDFAMEFGACAGMLMVHLSRFSEELVLWCSPQFDFVDLPDAFCTGSSIMPQKKNPDVPELVRGKSSRVIGNLTSLLVLMKGQPLAYNRDNQEDKEPLFDSVDTVASCLQVYSGMLAAMRVKRDRLLKATEAGFTTATDLADYLVGKGVPFRDAHAVVGKAVRRAIESRCDLADLPLAELKACHAVIDNDVYEILTVAGSVAARKHVGGTAPEQVRAAAGRARQRLAAIR